MNIKHLPSAGTFSKDPSAFGLSKDYYSVWGKGSNVMLSDNRVYLDWICGLGTNLLGYSNEEFNRAVAERVNHGVGFSLIHKLEYVVAEQLATMLGERIDGWDKNSTQVRFAKTGSDVCAMAIRLARAITGKSVIISGGYHGTLAEFVSSTAPAYGIPEEYTRSVQTFDVGDLNSFVNAISEVGGGNVAAVIVEHPVTMPGTEYYTAIRKFCNSTGALFIMDEVVTGLRFGLGGASEEYGISPDLICMGKAMGNGLPISALVGDREYMSWFGRIDPVFFSSTHFGDALSLTAANVVLKIWDDKKVEYIWDIGNQLMVELFLAGWNVNGCGGRSVIEFGSIDERAFFIQGMMKRGILMNRPNFTNLAHTLDDVERTRIAAEEVRKEMECLDVDELRIFTKSTTPRVLFSNR